jgi:hypothetical protein
MYMFGIVVADSDETPIGRASAALRAQLPAIFPEHVFEFVEPEKLSDVEPREAEELLFHVFAAEARRVIDDEPLNEIASPDIVRTIQMAVDKIVAKAKARSVN